MDIVASEVQSRRLEVEWDLRAQNDAVRADAARLQQVLWNLVKNAVKFTPPGGALSVCSREAPSSDPSRIAPRVIIEFRDTGIGIDPEFLPKVFDAFEQCEAGVWTRQHGGLGPGLAISQSAASIEM